MARKTKTAVVERIERLFETKETDELPFRTIIRELGISPNKAVGTLSSWPGVFEKTRTTKMGHTISSMETHTVWRHIPDKRVSLDEIAEIYQLTLEAMAYLIEPGTQNLRWKCWTVEPDAKGRYSRQRIHYIVRKLLCDLENESCGAGVPARR